MYHMGDDDTQDDWSEGARDDADGRKDQEQCPREEGCGGNPTGWKPEGAGRWTRTGAQGAGDQQPRLGAAAEGKTRGPTQEGGGRGTGEAGATADGSTPRTASAAEGEDAEGGDTTRAGKHRRRQTAAEAEREERAASDGRRAEELRRQLERASAVQEQSYQYGKGGFGSEAALSEAARGFVLQVQRTQAQASEMGVEPVTCDGRTLLELSPAELAQWEQDNLGDDQMRD